MVNYKSGQGRRILSIILVMMLIVSSLLYSSISTGTGSADESPIVTSQPIEESLAIDQTAEIENILLGITDELVLNYTRKLQDFETRYSYAVEKNFNASEFIYESFRANGLITYYDYFIYTRKMRNVIAEIPGKTTPDNIYIISSHYDSTTNIPYKAAPGADDNGSGTAGVLAAAEILSDYEFNSTIRFIAFSGEEQGMKGSQQYVNKVFAAGENISGVINLDMIAYNPDPGTNTVYMCKDYDDAGTSDNLTAFANQTAQKYEHITGIRTVDKSFGSSDHATFAPAFPAFMFIESEFQSNPNYHKTTDTVDYLNFTYATNVTQIAIATISELAGLNSTDISPPAIHDEFPLPGGYGRENTTISAILQDPAGMNQSTIRMFINGSEVVPLLNTVPLGLNISYTPPSDLPDGDLITIRIMGNDSKGNYLDHNWTFTVDGVFPELPTGIDIDLTRVEMVKQGLAIDNGSSGDPDYVHALAPSVIFQDGEYKMWYSGYNSKYTILFANSSDGNNWNKQGLVLSTGANGELDDGGVGFASVMFFDNEYKMWYSGYDGYTWRIFYANSTDGLSWNKQGLVIDIGENWEPDDRGSYTPSVIFEDGEYKMWYTGGGLIIESILYANSSDGLNWTKRVEPIITHSLEGYYDSFIVYAPSVIKTVDEYKMWFTACSSDIVYRVIYANSSDGLDWNVQGMAIDRGSGSELDSSQVRYTSAFEDGGIIRVWYSGYNGNWRIFQATISDNDMKNDLSIKWTPSSSSDIQYYELVRAGTPSGLSGSPSYLKMRGNTIVERGIGDNNASNYYYTIRVADRVGHVSQHPVIVGKIGVGTVTGWNLISSPFLEGDVALDTALSSLSWEAANYYVPTTPSDHWRSNYSSRPEQFNDLDSINNTMALWVSGPDDYFVTIGEVRNITIQLYSGWNFISYPYHEEKQVQNALFGLPYTIVEGFDDTAPYRLTTLSATDTMRPGLGYWIYCSSAAEWRVEQP